STAPAATPRPPRNRKPSTAPTSRPRVRRGTGRPEARSKARATASAAAVPAARPLRQYIAPAAAPNSAPSSPTKEPLPRISRNVRNRSSIAPLRREPPRRSGPLFSVTATAGNEQRVTPMPEIYVSTDIETDGPIPGPHSLLSFASAAYRADKTLVRTFTANL